MHENNQKEVNIGLIERPIPPIREYFEEEDMERLVASIRENGILVPLLVRPKGDTYEVIDGDRRLAAAWTAGIRQIPIIIRALDDRETHIQRMLANKDRADTDPVSEAKYIARLISEKIFTPEEYAEKIGRSVDWIADRLAIAEMPQYMQNALQAKVVPLGVCLEIVQVKDTGTMERYFREAVRSGMTIHAARISRMTVNEAIDALAESEKPITEEDLPPVQIIPQVRCELTGEMIPITGTHMIRVGTENYRKFRIELGI
jgi:ParB family chromosome partitioning protein